MFHKQCENSEMSCEASSLVRTASGPPETIGGVKAAINRAARALGWNFSRTREIWYGRARRIDAFEMDQLRKLATEQAQKYERIADAMRNTDADFYGPDVLALVHMARRLRGEDGP